MENVGIRSELSPNNMNMNKNNTDLDISWLTMLCLLARMHENGADLSKIMKLDALRDDRDYIQNCPSVEWEQDMGAHIPFCKLDGEMCNMQCRNRNSYSSYNEGIYNIIGGKNNVRKDFGEDRFHERRSF